MDKDLYDIVEVLEADLDNTIIHDHSFEDCLGEVLNGSDDIHYKTNSNVLISNGRVEGAQTVKALVSNLGLSSDLGQPFDSNVSVGASGIKINAIDGYASLIHRKWDDKKFTYKQGGLKNKGKANEQLLSFDQYSVEVDGRFGSFDYDEQSIDLSIQYADEDLIIEYPPHTYDYGVSEGLAKPVIFGKVFGYKPREIGDGVWQFHDGAVGLVDASDTLFTTPQYYYFGNGFSFPFAPVLEGASGALGASFNSSDFDFIEVNDTELSATKFSTSVTTESPDVVLSTTGNDIVISKSDDFSSGIIDGYNVGWKQISNQKVESKSSPKITVETTGDVFFVTEADGFVFDTYNIKFKANGSGSVVITCEEEMINTEMVLRGVRTDFHTISNWSQTPVINPAFPAGVNDEVNSDVVFRQLNNETIIFDFASTDDSVLVALWFKDIETYLPLTADVFISMDRKLTDVSALFLSGGGSFALLDSTTDNDFSPYSNGSGGVLDFDGIIKDIQLSVDIGRSPATFRLISGFESNDDYGAYIDSDAIVLCPEPKPATNQGEARAVWGGKPSYGNAVSVREAHRVTFDARIVFPNSSSIGENIKDVEIVAEYFQGFPAAFNSSLSKLIRVGEDWGSYSATFRTPEGDMPEIYILATQGALDVAAGSGHNSRATNLDNDPYCLEITNFRAYPVKKNDASIIVRTLDDGEREELHTFRVSNPERYSQVPTQVSVYGLNGRIKTSSTYTEIEGDFIGADENQFSVDAIRQMSIQATGKDLIQSSFTGNQIGFPVDARKPWLDHARIEVGNPLDYIIEPLPENKLLDVQQRWRQDADNDDFIINERDIIVGSVSRVGKEPRQSRYIINYRKNHSNPDKTSQITSTVGHYGLAERVIDTPLRGKVAAGQLADLIGRDSRPNSLFEFRLKGVGLGYKKNMAGWVNHPLIQRGYGCTIIGMDEDSGTRETTLRIKVFR